MHRYIKICCIVILIWATACKKNNDAAKVSLPYFISAELEPIWLNNPDKDTHKIGDFFFTDQDGQTISRKTVEDKMYVANFFFTICPGICPIMTDNMYRIQEEIKNRNDILLLSHTVTPWIDNVERLKAYANEKKVNSNIWHLLTGAEEEIYEIARDSYFADKEIGHKTDEDDFLHTENFILVDKDQRVRGIYNGTIDSDIKRLLEDVEILTLEYKSLITY